MHFRQSAQHATPVRAVHLAKVSPHLSVKVILGGFGLPPPPRQVTAATFPPVTAPKTKFRVLRDKFAPATPSGEAIERAADCCFHVATLLRYRFTLARIAQGAKNNELSQAAVTIVIIRSGFFMGCLP